MRTFASGATRDTDEGKLDFEAYLSPMVLERYAQFMAHHARQADGRIRPGDNWQKGIPRDAYMKSMWRHFRTVWLHHRSLSAMTDESMEEALCAVLFNAMGMLHEVMLGRDVGMGRGVSSDEGVAAADAMALRTGATATAGATWAWGEASAATRGSPPL